MELLLDAAKNPKIKRFKNNYAEKIEAIFFSKSLYILIIQRLLNFAEKKEKCSAKILEKNVNIVKL